MLASRCNLPIKNNFNHVRVLEGIDQEPKDSINKSSIVKNYLQEQDDKIKEFKQSLVKNVNILHRTNDNTIFFSPSNPSMIRFTSNCPKNKTKVQTQLPELYSTKHIGSVLVEILQNKNDTSVTMSFENNEALETVKGSISKLRETTASLVKSINLRVDNISKNISFLKGLNNI